MTPLDSQPAAANDGAEELADLCARISEELQSLNAAVDRTAEANAANLDGLSEVSGAIPSLAAGNDLRALTERLAEITRAQADECSFLRQSLATSRRQLATMRRQVNELRGGDSSIDPLTGLAARRRFEDALLRRMEAFRETGAGFCLALISIDRLTLILQKFGREVSDSVLTHFGHLLGQTYVNNDLAARFEPDVFALILNDADARNARRRLDETRQAFGATKLMARRGQRPIGRVSASFGLTAMRPEDAMSSLTVRAAKALHEAMSGGGDGVILRD